MMMYRFLYWKINIFISVIRSVSSGQLDVSPRWSGGIHPTAPSWPAAASQRSVLTVHRDVNVANLFLQCTHPKRIPVLKEGRELGDPQFILYWLQLFQCGSGNGSGSSIFCQCGSVDGSRIQGFDDQKMGIFLSKIAIFLSLGLHKGRISYRRSLQL
jgi:hypothetical protein